MHFRIDLEIFRGPLDLLLYLVRKHEVEVVEIPIAHVASQFLDYLEVLQRLDVNAAGEFLDMASTLIEIKSRMVLPHGDEVEEELDLTQQALVHRLLEYKGFRDAASMLQEHGRSWQERFPRLTNDLAGRHCDLAEQPIREVELWDLVSAFGRLLRDNAAARTSSIVYDDTPIHVFMQRIHQRLADADRLAFSTLFRPGMLKSTQVGMFLAILELVRHRHVQAEQNAIFGELWVLPGPNFDKPLDLTGVDTYDHAAAD